MRNARWGEGCTPSSSGRWHGHPRLCHPALSPPPLLRRLALLTPNGWALRAFIDLSTGPHRLSVVAAPLAGMLAFSVAVAVLAALIGRVRVAR